MLNPPLSPQPDQTSSVQIKNLSRIKNVIRVKHPLDGLHVGNFFRRAGIAQIRFFGHADTMFGRNRTIVFLNGFKHRLVHCLALGKKRLLAHMLGFENIQVQVAVANVAELDNLKVRVVGLHNRVDILWFEFCNRIKESSFCIKLFFISVTEKIGILCISESV